MDKSILTDKHNPADGDDEAEVAVSYADSHVLLQLVEVAIDSQ